jgi:hypothetical protein
MGCEGASVCGRKAWDYGKISSYNELAFSLSPHYLGSCMRLSRGKMLILISALSVAITIGAVIFLTQYDLPNPACANRQELFYWLAYKDLSKQSGQIRLILANRLEEECTKGLDWQNVRVQLDETQQNRIWNNMALLLRPWFVEKARSYGKLTIEKRPGYVDRLIDNIAVWRGIENLLPNRTKVSRGEKTYVGLSNLLRNEIDQAQQESDPPDREQIGELWNALKLRWLVRNLTSPSAACSL